MNPEDDRPPVEFRHPWRLALLAALTFAALIAWAFWDANQASADDSGIVVSCQTVQVWDAYNLGTVTVTRPGGTSVHTPGNALTVPYVTAAGPVVSITTAHHTYTVTAPSGCTTTTTGTTTTTVPATSTTGVVTTTTAPFGVTSSSVPPTITPPQPPQAPPGPTPTAQTGDPSVASTTVPPARPATPTVASPTFTG